MTTPEQGTSVRFRLPVVPIPAHWDVIDEAVDSWFETHLRGRPIADSVMYTASALGDHGVLWMLFGAIQAARIPEHGTWRLVRVTAALGLESLLVNGPVKWVFRRSRPPRLIPVSRWLRTPRTSSFPSGHASAAFFGAALLRDGDPLWPLYYAVAAIVAASRVHVRMHHASDVIGGALIGAMLGEAARRLIPQPVTAVAPVQEAATGDTGSRGLRVVSADG